jgi:peroxiredoxin
VIEEVVMISNDYKVQGLGVVISSNDVVNYPQDAPELMTEFAFENNFDFPYLYDETQEVAKAYNAACTPDFFYMTVKTN